MPYFQAARTRPTRFLSARRRFSSIGDEDDGGCTRWEYLLCWRQTLPLRGESFLSKSCELLDGEIINCRRPERFCCAEILSCRSFTSPDHHCRRQTLPCAEVLFLAQFHELPNSEVITVDTKRFRARKC